MNNIGRSNKLHTWHMRLKSYLFCRTSQSQVQIVTVMRNYCHIGDTKERKLCLQGFFISWMSIKPEATGLGMCQNNFLILNNWEWQKQIIFKRSFCHFIPFWILCSTRRTSYAPCLYYTRHHSQTHISGRARSLRLYPLQDIWALGSGPVSVSREHRAPRQYLVSCEILFNLEQKFCNKWVITKNQRRLAHLSLSANFLVFQVILKGGIS